MAPDTLLSLKLFAPELALVALLMVLFTVDAVEERSRSSLVPLFATIAACAVGAVFTSAWALLKPEAYFSGLVASDGLAAFFRYFFLFTCAAGLYVAYGSKELTPKYRMEFALLLVCVTFGMSIMAIATNLLLLYIGIETVSIVSFVMAGFNRENLRSNEASLKYLIYGALSSGLMIYGFSLIYGYTGSLYYPQVAKFLQMQNGHLPFVFQIACLMVYAGLAFKISAFPMHFWTPDVYEGSPTPVAAFFSVGPKAAGFAAFIRLFLDVFAVKTGDGTWKALEGTLFVPALALLSAATMTVGNLSAIGQTNTKRLLAYSSIAHVGYMLMGLVALNEAGISAILFYLVAYCAMNLGAFWIVGIVADLRGSEDIEAFRGIGWEMPLLGTCMGVFLFSLTGIPMFAGFVGKFLLFGAVLTAPGYLWLALLGVINSVVSLYYYAKILKAMWLDRPVAVEGGGAAVPCLPIYHAVGLLGLAVPTVILGLFFAPIVRFAKVSLAALL